MGSFTASHLLGHWFSLVCADCFARSPSILYMASSGFSGFLLPPKNRLGCGRGASGDTGILSSMHKIMFITKLCAVSLIGLKKSAVLFCDLFRQFISHVCQMCQVNIETSKNKV